MKIHVTKNYTESCTVVADLICDVITQKPNAKLGLATGGTPVPVYEQLIARNQDGKVDFSKVCTVNLDEYCGLAETHPQSYRYFMNFNLFDHININKTNTFVASGLGDAKENAKKLTEMVYADGTPDLQLLGIGNNGHIAFNEAGEQLTDCAHIETLDQSTIDANARFFDQASDVPTTAITMGMGEILAAKQIVLLATSLAKADAIRGLIVDPFITTQNPSTLLKVHPNVIVVIDEELAAAAGYNNL